MARPIDTILGSHSGGSVNRYMCGFAGIIRWHQPGATTPDAADLGRWGRMLQSIAHRGPNSQGRWIDPRTNASVLLHARLAIIDLTSGWQPMSNENGAIQVVFNGEIYNHVELRRELLATGHRFRSNHSDTEVLVHGWEQWQTELPKHLVGMFSLAIWDTRSDTLFLARDRMGQKPLFYMPISQGVAFASTIPSLLLAVDGSPRASMEGITSYLTLGYMPPPDTLYPAIQQVNPGYSVRFNANGSHNICYWQCAPLEPAGKSTTTNPTEGIRAVLSQAVQSQLIADVPMSCFLSGGVDSSIIAALAQQHQHAINAEPITTVCVGFDEDGFDESSIARSVARHIGSRHQELRLTIPKDAIDTLDWLVAKVLGQPFADSSLLATYHLSNVARSLGPVAISGDGADEAFGGYDRYRAMYLMGRFPWLMKLATLMPRYRTSERFRRLLIACKGHTWDKQYAGLTDIFSPADLALIIPGFHTEAFGQEDNVEKVFEGLSPARKAMLLDQLCYLPGDVLWKVDSGSMANALEVRSPFLDHRVVEFARSLPDSLILNGRRGKLLLHDAFGSLLPPEVFTRAKHGFALPIGEWFRNRLKDALIDRLTTSSGFCRGYLFMPNIHLLIDEHLSRRRDHTHRLFALLMLELWFNRFRPTIDQ